MTSPGRRFGGGTAAGDDAPPAVVEPVDGAAPVVPVAPLPPPLPALDPAPLAGVEPPPAPPPPSSASSGAISAPAALSPSEVTKSTALPAAPSGDGSGSAAIALS